MSDPKVGKRRRKAPVRLATQLAFAVTVVTARSMISSAWIQHSTTSHHGQLLMVSRTLEPETITDPLISMSDEKDEITMDDVVNAASIELEKHKNMQEMKLYKTPFELFEEHDKARVTESEQVGLDRLQINEDEKDHRRESDWGGTIYQSEIVSWNYLKALMEMGTSSFSDSVNDQVIDLYQRFQKSGGFLVLQLDEDDASTVSDMWSTMEAYFSLPSEQLEVDTQILTKDDGSHDPEAGYHFRQTYMNINGEILPETIQNALETHSDSEDRATHDRGIEGSYKLFADITKTVGTIIAAGALEKDLQLMDKVASTMLDEKNGHPFVNADHRLCRYILGNKTKKAKESLISHTDWTFTTCIPLSAIPGLQVWKPNEEKWIVPEAILGGKDRTRYVVVMAGKWIELLTNQKITSCVHRVVTMNDGTQDETMARLSAPFFCRTKRAIFDTFQDAFDESWEAPPGGMSQEEAIDSMGQVFADWIRFLDGDRDPSIQDCVVDLCFDQGDKMPGCFSVEKVLLDFE